MNVIRLKGGAGSGFHGHKGRPGFEGGSLPRESLSSKDSSFEINNISDIKSMIKTLEEYGGGIYRNTSHGRDYYEEVIEISPNKVMLLSNNNTRFSVRISELLSKVRIDLGDLPNKPQSELSSEDRNNWAINIAKSDTLSKLLDKNGNIAVEHTELANEMQTFPYSGYDKERFVSYIKNVISQAKTLPRAKKPSSNSRWVFETPKDSMPPEIMYYLQQHFKKQGSRSQHILPSEFLEYSGGVLDERTLDYIYSESLRPYFQWEHMANLNQLVLKRPYVYSEEGISDSNARLGKSLKFLGLTPSKLYDELIELRP